MFPGFPLKRKGNIRIYPCVRVRFILQTNVGLPALKSRVCGTRVLSSVKSKHLVMGRDGELAVIPYEDPKRYISTGRTSDSLSLILKLTARS